MRLNPICLSLLLILLLFSCKNRESQTEQPIMADESGAMIDTLVAPDSTTTELNTSEKITEEKSDIEPEPDVQTPPPPPPLKDNTISISTNSSSKPKFETNTVKISKNSKNPQGAEKVAFQIEAQTQPVKNIPDPEKNLIIESKPQKADHLAWDKLLRLYVTSTGKVNYAGLKAKKSELDAYLQHLAERPVAEDWSRAEKMAYWINAYNAFTVKLIVDNYPVNSITNLHGGKPWDVKWINLGDKTYSLNQIEHDILRPEFKDARIHFAVNCAARSCPPLLNKAWTAENLSNYLDKQAKSFINNEQFNKIAADKVQISKIFEWYAEDFGKIIDYLNKYSNTTINSGAKVMYLEYDWALNK